MDAFRFISWWWGKKAAGEKAFLLLITWALMTIPFSFIFATPIGLFMFIGGIVFVLVGSFFHMLWKSLKEEWETYKVEREAEAQKIINRLAGTERYTADDILAQIRKRRGTP